MNTELKNSTSKIVAEIKQEVLRLTQENEVLRNCWLAEQAESEELRTRLRQIYQENADLRHRVDSLLSQIHLLEQGFYAVAEGEKIAQRVRHFERRVHNLEPGTIFKSPTK